VLPVTIVLRSQQFQHLQPLHLVVEFAQFSISVLSAQVSLLLVPMEPFKTRQHSHLVSFAHPATLVRPEFKKNVKRIAFAIKL
jgi:hypothetical protein